MVLTITMMLCWIVLLMFQIWVSAEFMPMRQLAGFFPQDVQAALKPRLDSIKTTPKVIIGRILLAVTMILYVVVLIWAGADGMKNGYSFMQFMIRFLVIFLGTKAFDMIGLDYFLLTKTQFFQKRFPETKDCEGWKQYGYNRKQQISQIIMLVILSPVLAALCVWICG